MKTPAVTTIPKAWNRCRRFGCKHPTLSGLSEKNPEKRLCRYHVPQAEAIMRDELERGRVRHATCAQPKGRFLPACTTSESLPACSFSVASFASSCLFPRRTCMTEADAYYATHPTKVCRYSTAAWKRKTIPWSFGDPSPIDLWEGDEDE